MTAEDPRPGLLALARAAHQRGWTWATSGNFSCRLSQERIAVTASGVDKGRLEAADSVILDEEGRQVDADGAKPSAEAALHVAIYRLFPSTVAIAHTHSVAAVVLSRRYAAAGEIELADYEMAKALSGVTTHEHRERLPIFGNTQEPASLAVPLQNAQRQGTLHGFLVQGHGLYTWGRSIVETERHLEALEFLLECKLHEAR